MTTTIPSPETANDTTRKSEELPIVVTKDFQYSIVFSHSIPDHLLPSVDKKPKHSRDDDEPEEIDLEDSEEPEEDNTFTANIYEPARTNNIFNFLNTISFLADNEAIPRGAIIFCNTATLPKPQLIFTDRLRWLQLINEPYPTNFFHVIERIGKPLHITCGSRKTNAQKRVGSYKVLPTISDGLPYFYVSINSKPMALEIYVNSKDRKKPEDTKKKGYYHNAVCVTGKNTYYLKCFLEGFMHSDDYIFTSAPFDPLLSVPGTATISGSELALRLTKINNFMHNHYAVDNKSNIFPSYQISDKQVKEILNNLSSVIGK